MCILENIWASVHPSLPQQKETCINPLHGFSQESALSYQRIDKYQSSLQLIEIGKRLALFSEEFFFFFFTIEMN
jgi:hypothetical protein